MAVNQPAGAVRTIATGEFTDAVMSRDGRTLYAAHDGTLTAYDIATGAEGRSWALGATLGGLDMSVDGRYLVAVEQAAAGPQHGQSQTIDYSIFRIDLTTGVAATYLLPQTGSYTHNFYDAAFLPDGKVLLSNQGYWTPLTTYDFATGTQTTTREIFASSSALSATADHGHIAVLPAHISDAPVYVYTAGTGITASHGNYADDIYGYNRGAQAISRDGSHILQGEGLHLYDGSAHLQAALALNLPLGQIAGAVFSPDAAFAYVLDQPSREVFRIDTATHAVTAAYPTMTAADGAATGFGDGLSISSDGRYLFVVGSDAIRVVDLATAVSDLATAGNDTLIADADHPGRYGFGGDDTLYDGQGSGAGDVVITLDGGPGNDTYYVDRASTVVRETVVDAGVDTVVSHQSFTLPAGIENLVLVGEDATTGTGNNGANRITAGTADSYITGGFGNDTLLGNSGDDLIFGGDGNDSVDGGNGNDVLFGDADDGWSGGSLAYGNDIVSGGLGDDYIDGGVGNDTAVFSGRLGDGSTVIRARHGALFVSGIDGRDTLVGIETLRFANGTVEVTSADPDVDNLYYAQRYGDVFAAGADPARHYHDYGRHEGRDPNALFSTVGYLAANADVRVADGDPLTHFATFGWKEGRDPSAGFDAGLYLRHNPDVAASGGDPLAHYLRFGQAEGRATYAAIGPHIDADGFDAEYYLLAYPDVARAAIAAGGNAAAFARAHYETYGWHEGRDPNAWFDTSGYLAAYHDVAAAGVDPLDHYAEYGWHEGRDPSAGFDTIGYLHTNSDVAAAGINPLVHYLDYGAMELRPTNGDGAFHI